ncbi:TetR family transcriptional regulator [Actinoplanes sp. SE50]|uniref:TetR/AcrR family transcriptional regulator n=1 Tax=unclassified Actinoplanes TaxID=2626549 RepID=UPI00023EC785|nr:MULTISPECIES: TetR/AcrR family transcriptional regulator [unclassified Actinoplanes]AEV83663.1 transcriptional regulator, TetR family [Actinoplanes sp. SE50/110]ATO82193.1 TetR family transcriptional regulator [Actinoplanes sp. SE50]SLL99600.1 TetR family transcriptional regulator [Actinoplanes sp. SE50/110]
MTSDVRAALIAATERLLADSPDHDIATRAVCDWVGVTQPVLYRIFGDKKGLLDAVADDGLRRYAQRKQSLEPTGDPVADLRAGWDDHMTFAHENPAIYQLMFSPRPRSHARARQKIMDLLQATLTRCSAIGALRVAPGLAAQMILPANVGLALSLIAQPELFDDPSLSIRMREAVLGAVLTEPATHGEEADPVPAAALRLRSQLTVSGTRVLEPAEAALLDRWLERLST